MDRTLIETFLTLIETNSISNAAKVLYITQPTVSTRLKQLENQVGTELFIRNQGVKGIILTSKGEQFIQVAEKWMQLYNETNDFLGKSLIHRLNIAASESINLYFLSNIYNQVSANEKNIFLNIQTTESSKIAELLLKREIDVGFSYLPIDHRSLSCNKLFTQELVVIEKSTTKRSSYIVDYSELDPAMEIVVDTTNLGNNTTISEEKPLIQVDSTSLILNSLRIEGAYCVVPSIVANKFSKLEDLHVYPLKNPPAPIVSYIVTNTSMRSSAKVSLKILKKYIDNQLNLTKDKL